MNSSWNRPPSASTMVGAGLVAPLLVAWLLSLFGSGLENTNAALVLVLVVVAVASAGYRGAGAVAAVSSTVWFDFFLTEPVHRLAISSGDDVMTAVLLVVVGLAVTEIALWGRRQQGGSSRRSGYLDGMVSAARLMSDLGTGGRNGDTAELVDLVGRQVAEVLGVESCRYEWGPGPVGGFVFTPDGDVRRRGFDVDVDRSGLPTMDCVDLPVTHGRQVLGRYVVASATRVSRPDLEQRRVAVALAEQVGAALAQHLPQP